MHIDETYHKSSCVFASVPFSKLVTRLLYTLSQNFSFSFPFPSLFTFRFQCRNRPNTVFELAAVDNLHIILVTDVTPPAAAYIYSVDRRCCCQIGSWNDN
ncbi:hypothetical protein B9Z55_018673 [Caenorhabditis nigoni]|uniref:Uncharacterized protein n=1 Tax=Caenorhabditis nigoni TaxID=1611254 RepID=A0A2G5TFV5_9PELO|nr:hypothetical protein B9Z55_018673 [Caenorhabditis nigoni]